MNGTAASGVGVRIGVAAGILLIIIIGGRIVPSFTGNWLAKRESGRMPSSFGVIDQVSLVITGAALATWVTFPASVPTGILGILAGAMNHCPACAMGGMEDVGRAVGRHPSHWIPVRPGQGSC
jgi:uncharacterized protein involved in response to NO